MFRGFNVEENCDSLFYDIFYKSFEMKIQLSCPNITTWMENLDVTDFFCNKFDYFKLIQYIIKYTDIV